MHKEQYTGGVICTANKQTPDAGRTEQPPVIPQESRRGRAMQTESLLELKTGERKAVVVIRCCCCCFNNVRQSRPVGASRKRLRGHNYLVEWSKLQTCLASGTSHSFLSSALVAGREPSVLWTPATKGQQRWYLYAWTSHEPTDKVQLVILREEMGIQLRLPSYAWLCKLHGRMG